jgi:DNA-directed RNA polymerase specialized sigma24 family protein
LNKEFVSMTTCDNASAGLGLEHLHVSFLKILPKIVKQARFSFRGYRCLADRDDAVQETVAIAWKWYVRLAQRGKNAAAFPTVLASYAVRHVRGGRRLCGSGDGRGGLEPAAIKRHDLAFQMLKDLARFHGEVWKETLQDNTRSSPGDSAAFRVDFSQWLSTLGERDRHLVNDLLVGERPSAVAERLAISRARVSQLRRSLRQGWLRFHEEPLDRTEEAYLASA